MTRAEFLKKLAALKRNAWQIDKAGDVRCRRGDCPILAVAKAEGINLDGNSAYQEAGRALGLARDVAERVMCAADWPTTDEDKPLRRAMLKALDLQESKA